MRPEMKSYSSWNRAPARGGNNSASRGRRNNSNSKFPRPHFSHHHQGYNNHHSMKNSRYPSQENVKSRQIFVSKALTGQTVRIEKTNGVHLKGLLVEANESAGQLTLENAMITSQGPETKEELTPDSSKYVIEWKDVVYINGDEVDDKLKTDGDISKQKKIVGRTLQAPDAGWLQEPTNGAMHFDTREDTKSWDQFKTNEEKFGVKGTYDENLYTTKLDKSALTDDQIRQAEKTAREIESQTTSNVHLAEERNQKIESVDDEESKYSSVNKVVPPPSHPPPQMAIPQMPKPTSHPPMSFAEALRRGQHVPPPPPPPPTKFQTRRIPPVQNLPSTPQAKSSSSSGKEKMDNLKTPVSKLQTPGKVPLAEKYKVSDENFQARQLRQKAEKKMLTPTTKNWDAHQHTRGKLEAGKSMSKEAQIADFKKFSASLEKKKVKEHKHSAPVEKGDPVKKTLNVNAKEFKPLPPPPPAMEPTSSKTEGSSGQSSTTGHNNSSGKPHQHHNPHLNNQRQASNSNISVGSTPQNIPQMQPGMIQMPFPPFQPQPGFPMQVPVNMMHPYVIQGPQGLQHVPVMPGMHPQNPQFQGMMQNPQQMMFPQMQGQPYFVQMMPQGPQFQGQPRMMFNPQAQQQQQMGGEQNQKHNTQNQHQQQT